MKVELSIFKNPDIRELVKSAASFSALILNDVSPKDADGNVMVKIEKERTDHKLRRSYYNAVFLSMENIGVGRTVTFWQTLSPDGKSLVWKNALNPVIANKLLGSNMEGHIVQIEYAKERDIINSVGEVITSNKNTLFVPTMDKLEDLVFQDCIQNGWIKDPALVDEEDKNNEDQNKPLVGAVVSGGMNTAE